MTEFVILGPLVQRGLGKADRGIVGAYGIQKTDYKYDKQSLPLHKGGI